MANLEQLLAGHAYWSDKIKELREQGSAEYNKCCGTQRTRHFNDGGDSPIFGRTIPSEWYSGQTCIERVAAMWREVNESGYDEYYPYDDLFYAGEDDWIPCKHCMKTRELKRERMYASRRLGAIRGAMTRVGRGINYEADE